MKHRKPLVFVKCKLCGQDVTASRFKSHVQSRCPFRKRTEFETGIVEKFQEILRKRLSLLAEHRISTDECDSIESLESLEKLLEDCRRSVQAVLFQKRKRVATPKSPAVKQPFLPSGKPRISPR